MLIPNARREQLSPCSEPPPFKFRLKSPLKNLRSLLLCVKESLMGDHVPLPASVQQVLTTICERHSISPPDVVGAKSQLASLGEEESLTILRKISNSTHIRTLTGYIIYMKKIARGESNWSPTSRPSTSGGGTPFSSPSPGKSISTPPSRPSPSGSGSPFSASSPGCHQEEARNPLSHQGREKLLKARKREVGFSSSAPSPSTEWEDSSDYDEMVFHSARSASLWSTFCSLPVILEKQVIVEHFSPIHLLERFSALGWESILNIDRPCYKGLVRRFYCNLEAMEEGEFAIVSMVKSVEIILTVDRLAEIMGISSEGIHYYCPPSTRGIGPLMSQDMQEHIYEVISGLPARPASELDFSPEGRVFARLVQFNLAPRSGHRNQVGFMPTYVAACLLSALEGNVPRLCLPYFMLRSMHHHALHPEDASLPYGRALTLVFEHFAVDLSEEEGSVPRDKFSARNLRQMNLRALMVKPQAAEEQEEGVPMDEDEHTRDDGSYFPHQEEVLEEVPLDTKAADPAFHGVGGSRSARASGPDMPTASGTQTSVPPPTGEAPILQDILSELRSLRESQAKLRGQLGESATREQELLRRVEENSGRELQMWRQFGEMESRFQRLTWDMYHSSRVISADIRCVQKRVVRLHDRFTHWDMRLGIDSRVHLGEPFDASNDDSDSDSD
ncbi:uncharacterized protein LOC122061542 isoform X1 [Macadamia integrifolia]|uniref:uncharacterized protein LOC122061542 isoform X1 n=1 Tax=Macadamia integrifolia TaxID=60698 RepID=UPI001C4E8150|nr:uncharacterized protein LOC122061542 isoform X1 [Macadamia integrifolia]